jgi:hypothetical protein
MGSEAGVPNTKQNPPNKDAVNRLRDLELEYDLRATAAVKLISQKEFGSAGEAWKEIEAFAADAFGESHWRTTNARLSRHACEIFPKYTTDPNGKLKEQQLRTALKSAHVTGDKPSSATLRGQLLQHVAEWFGRNSAAYLRTLSDLIGLTNSSKDEITTRAVFEEYCAVTEEVYGTSFLTAKANGEYAQWLLSNDDASAALPVLRTAYSLMTNCEDRGNANWCGMIGLLANCELVVGDPRSAKTLYEEASEMAKKYDGELSKEYVCGVVGVAISNRVLGDFPSASREFQRAQQFSLHLPRDCNICIDLRTEIALFEALVGNSELAKHQLAENEEIISGLTPDERAERIRAYFKTCNC